MLTSCVVELNSRGSGCSKKRPDILLEMGSHVVIVVVNENQPQHIRLHLRAQASYVDSSGFEPSSLCDD